MYSNGRLILGIGAGWFGREYRAYGYEFPSAGTRLAILEETLQVMRPLWRDETVTFDGTHVHLDGAYCDPKPIQDLPAIWVGGGGEKVTLRLAAQHADATNWQVGLDEFVHKSGVLREHCDAIGRDVESIVRTHGPDCRIFDSEAEMAHWLATPEGGDLWGSDDIDGYVRDHLVGTVDQVVEKTQAFIDAGCREFVLWLRDFPESTTMERFMHEVVPELH